MSCLVFMQSKRNIVIIIISYRVVYYYLQHGAVFVLLHCHKLKLWHCVLKDILHIHCKKNELQNRK